MILWNIVLMFQLRDQLIIIIHIRRCVDLGYHESIDILCQCAAKIIKKQLAFDRIQPNVDSAVFEPSLSDVTGQILPGLLFINPGNRILQIDDDRVRILSKAAFTESLIVGRNE